MCFLREWGEVERRLRERQEAMNVKNEELDQENRRLRTLKCELETKVNSFSAVLGIWSASAAQPGKKSHYMRSCCMQAK